jgi:molecular chaperone DnaJ
VTIPTLTGEVELKIPEGVQHGDERVLRAKGIKRLNEAGFGNHYVHFHIEMPRSLNAKQREALQEFAKASGEEKVCDRRENIFKQTLNKVKSFMESRNKAKEKAADAEKSKDDSKKD